MGKLYTVGNNDYGQLGGGSSRITLLQVGTDTDWSIVVYDSTYSASCSAIKTNGTLWGWGANNIGQIGDGSTTQRTSPVQVGTLTTWATIEKGEYCSLALMTDGTMWSWGYGMNGRIGWDPLPGQGTTYCSVPTALLAGSTFTKISQGVYHGAAIKSNGTLWTWGANAFGECGIGNTTSQYTPVQVGSATDWVEVACGSYCTLAIKSDGTLWACGRGSGGRLGLNNTNSYYTLQQVGIATNWSKVKSSKTYAQEYPYGTSMALATDGTLWGWGSGYYKGHGQNSSSDILTPTQIGTATTWTELFCGYGGNLAKNSDGKIYGCGLNAWSNTTMNGTTSTSPGLVVIASSKDGSFASVGKINGAFIEAPYVPGPKSFTLSIAETCGQTNAIKRSRNVITSIAETRGQVNAVSRSRKLITSIAETRGQTTAIKRSRTMIVPINEGLVIVPTLFVDGTKYFSLSINESSGQSLVVKRSRSLISSISETLSHTFDLQTEHYVLFNSTINQQQSITTAVDVSRKLITSINETLTITPTLDRQRTKTFLFDVSQTQGVHNLVLSRDCEHTIVMTPTSAVNISDGSRPLWSNVAKLAVNEAAMAKADLGGSGYIESCDARVIFGNGTIPGNAEIRSLQVKCKTYSTTYRSYMDFNLSAGASTSTTTQTITSDVGSVLVPVTIDPLIDLFPDSPTSMWGTISGFPYTASIVNNNLSVLVNSRRFGIQTATWATNVTLTVNYVLRQQQLGPIDIDQLYDITGDLSRHLIVSPAINEQYNMSIDTISALVRLALSISQTQDSIADIIRTRDVQLLIDETYQQMWLGLTRLVEPTITIHESLSLGNPPLLRTRNVQSTINQTYSFTSSLVRLRNAIVTLIESYNIDFGQLLKIKQFQSQIDYLSTFSFGGLRRVREFIEVIEQVISEIYQIQRIRNANLTIDQTMSIATVIQRLREIQSVINQMYSIDLSLARQKQLVLTINEIKTLIFEIGKGKFFDFSTNETITISPSINRLIDLHGNIIEQYEIASHINRLLFNSFNIDETTSINIVIDRLSQLTFAISETYNIETSLSILKGLLIAISEIYNVAFDVNSGNLTFPGTFDVKISWDTWENVSISCSQSTWNLKTNTQTIRLNNRSFSTSDFTTTTWSTGDIGCVGQ